MEPDNPEDLHFHITFEAMIADLRATYKKYAHLGMRDEIDMLYADVGGEA